MNREKFLWRLNEALAIVFVCLFFWILYPIKWAKKLVFKAKLKRAKESAVEMSKRLNRAVYVCQNGTDIFIGTRDELREWNRTVRKDKPGFLDIDYRHAVVFKAVRGKGADHV